MIGKSNHSQFDRKIHGRESLSPFFNLNFILWAIWQWRINLSLDGKSISHLRQVLRFLSMTFIILLFPFTGIVDEALLSAFTVKISWICCDVLLGKGFVSSLLIMFDHNLSSLSSMYSSSFFTSRKFELNLVFGCTI